MFDDQGEGARTILILFLMRGRNLLGLPWRCCCCPDDVCALVKWTGLQGYGVDAELSPLFPETRDIRKHSFYSDGQENNADIHHNPRIFKVNVKIRYCREQGNSTSGQDGGWHRILKL